MRYSAELGLCSGVDAARAEGLLNSLGLKTRIPHLAGGPYRPDDLVAHMAHDKKARNGKLTLILSKGIGRAFIQRDADAGQLRRFLAAESGFPS
jgi:3-dehydroquinate synthetase